MATQTGSFDFKAAKAANDEAQDAKTQATNYLTDITGGGVYVHEDDANWSAATGDAVKITSSSVDVLKGGENVASFGTTARIGKAGSARINIDSTSLKAYNASGRSYLNMNENSMSLLNGKVVFDNTSFFVKNDRWSFDSWNIVTPVFQIASGGKGYTLSTAANGFEQVATNRFRMSDMLYNQFNNGTYRPHITIIYYNFELVAFRAFKFGVAGSVTRTAIAGAWTIAYDGTRTFTFTPPSGVGPVDRDAVECFGERESLTGIYPTSILGTELKPARGNSLVIGQWNKTSDSMFVIGNGQNGLYDNDESRSNAFEVTWDGNVLLALDTTATSGVDKDITSALQALGWTDCIV